MALEILNPLISISFQRNTMFRLIFQYWMQQTAAGGVDMTFQFNWTMNKTENMTSL